VQTAKGLIQSPEKGFGHIRALAPQRGRCARGAPEAALHRMRWVRSIQAAAGLVQVRPSDVGKMTVSSSFNLLSAPEGGKFCPHLAPSKSPVPVLDPNQQCIARAYRAERGDDRLPDGCFVMKDFDPGWGESVVCGWFTW
jgi:hypothetical protein